MGRFENIHTYVRTYISVSVCVWVQAVSVFVRMHRMYVHVYACTYVCTYVCV